MPGTSKRNIPRQIQSIAEPSYKCLAGMKLFHQKEIDVSLFDVMLAAPVGFSGAHGSLTRSPLAADGPRPPNRSAELRRNLATQARILSGQELDLFLYGN